MQKQSVMFISELHLNLLKLSFIPIKSIKSVLIVF